MVVTANMAPKSMLPLLTKRPVSELKVADKAKAFDLHLLRSSMSLTSWLLIGGLLQVLLFYTRVPPRVSLLFILIILGYRTGHALLITFRLIPNPYLRDAILHPHSAQIPDLDGNISPEPANEGVAVLHLGAKINHPLGGFAPHVQGLTDHTDRMYAALDTDLKRTNGYLGGNVFMSVDARDCVEITFISYWRSTDAIHAFAYSDLHRKAWEWWNAVPRDDISHLGINHEIFFAPKGCWETIFLNHQPTMMAATYSFRPGDKNLGGTVEDSWMANVVDASTGKLRTSAGRLNRAKEQLGERFGYYPRPTAGVTDDGRVLHGGGGGGEKEEVEG